MAIFIAGSSKKMDPLVCLWADHIINNLAAGGYRLHGDSEAETGIGRLMRTIDPSTMLKHKLFAGSLQTNKDHTTSMTMKECLRVALFEIDPSKTISEKLSEENERYARLALQQMRHVDVYAFDSQTKEIFDKTPPKQHADLLARKGLSIAHWIDQANIESFILTPRMEFELFRSQIKSERLELEAGGLIRKAKVIGAGGTPAIYTTYTRIIL